MNDIDRIHKIEEILGITLNCVPLVKLLTANNVKHKEFSYITGTNNYSLDDKGKVIGLSLFDQSFDLDIQTLIGGLSHLQQLSIKSANLSSCNFIQNLNDLFFLDLGGNQITDLSPLKELKQLTDLNLRDNQINDISPLQKLELLNKLSLSSNQTIDLFLLNELKQLKELEVSDCKIINLSLLKELKQLEMLWLFNCQLSDLSPLKELNQLTDLSLNKIQLNDLNLLKELKELKVLRLPNCQIIDLNPLKALNQLTQLWLFQNNITDLSPLRELKNLKELAVFVNPIKNIDTEIIKEFNCCQSLRDYWSAIDRYGETENKQLKILLLGNGRVGKSSVTDRLIDDTFDSQKASTHAIYLRPWSLPFDETKLDIKVWDFGGQDIYHGTHRLFMRNRTLYLLVWDAVSEYKATNADPAGNEFRNFRLHYWLDYISRFSPCCPIIIVQNKAGEQQENDERAPDKIEELKQRYHIVDYISLSTAKGGAKIKELEQKIQKAVRTMDDVLRPIPLPWQTVRERLDQLALAEDSITYEHYQSICEEEHISEISPSSEKSLIEFLHATGTVYYSAEVSDQIILNQRWAIEAIYSLFDRDETYFRLLEKGHGRFTRTELAETVWKAYSKATQEVFLGFMRSAELCFKLIGDSWENKDTDVYIAPQLLPDISHEKQARRLAHYGDVLHLRYRHEFYHEGILHRFIARVGQKIDNVSDFYRNFIEVQDERGNRALIQEIERKTDSSSDLSGTLQISICGPQAKDFLDRVRNEFEDIAVQNDLETYVSVNGIDYVSLPDVEENYKAEIPVMLSLQKNKVQPADFVPFFNRETQNSLTETKTQDKQALNLKANVGMDKEIYFSYAWANEKNPDIEKPVNELYEALNKDFDVKRDKMDLGYKGLISEFMEKIGNSRLVVVAISQKYLQSEYCMNELYQIWLSSQGKKKEFVERIFPIWVEDIDLNDFDLLDVIYEHWENLYDKSQQFLSKRARMIGPEELDRIKMIETAKQKISELISSLKDINALKPKYLLANDAEIIKQSIRAKMNRGE